MQRDAGGEAGAGRGFDGLPAASEGCDVPRGLGAGDRAGLLLHGNAYVQMVFDGDGQPAALQTLRPDKVELELDRRMQPAALIYRSDDAATRFALKDE